MADLLSKVDKLKGRKLVIVGDVGVDEYVMGQVKRISPEAPVPVLEVEGEDARLGLATNVAQNVASLEGIPFLVSVVGEDVYADQLRQLLQKASVSPAHLIEDSSRPTTRKLRVMAGHHHIVRVDYEKRKFLAPQIQEKLVHKAQELVPQSDGIILQDYSKGVLSEACIQDLIKLGKRYSKIVTVDPYRSTPIRYYRGADLMTPNFDESLALATIPADDIRGVSESMNEVGSSLMKSIESKQMVITRGKDGMSLFQNGLTERIPTFAQQVFDVTGAGDTVIAALTLAWASGLTLKDSCIIANFAAGVVVGKVGCVPCSTQELVEFIRIHGPTLLQN